MARIHFVNEKKKVKAAPKIEPKNKTCSKCAFAYLMQNGKENPIVSECTKTKERFVASSPHSEICFFQETKEEQVIHEMIFLK